MGENVQVQLDTNIQREGRRNIKRLPGARSSTCRHRSEVNSTEKCPEYWMFLNEERNNREPYAEVAQPSVRSSYPSLYPLTYTSLSFHGFGNMKIGHTAMKRKRNCRNSVNKYQEAVPTLKSLSARAAYRDEVNPGNIILANELHSQDVRVWRR